MATPPTPVPGQGNTPPLPSDFVHQAHAPQEGELVNFLLPNGPHRGQVRPALLVKVHGEAGTPNPSVDLRVLAQPADLLAAPATQRSCVAYGTAYGEYHWPSPAPAEQSTHAALEHARALLAGTLTEGRADDGSLPPHAQAEDTPAPGEDAS